MKYTPLTSAQTSLVAHFLRNGGSLSDVAAKGINVTRHKDFPELVHFKYSQFGSDVSDPFVRECRSLVLDESDSWNTVVNCMPRFFNYGEVTADPIDWSTARVQEKVDGSLIQVAWYKERWIVTTSGTPDASGKVGSHGLDFSELFWSTHEKLFGSREIVGGIKTYTYIFELCTPLNRVVVTHKEPKIVLITMRRTIDGWEYRDFLNATYPRPKVFNLGTLEDTVASLALLPPTEQEGYVITDSQLRRIKCKSPAYVALSHLKDRGTTLKSLTEVYLKGEFPELLSAFPEWEPVTDLISSKFRWLEWRVDCEFQSLKHIESQKDFALEALKTPWSNFLFLMRKGTDLKDIIQQTRTEHLVNYLGLDKTSVSDLLLKHDKSANY